MYFLQKREINTKIYKKIHIKIMTLNWFWTKKRRAFLTNSSIDFYNDMDSFKCEGEVASYVSRA